MDTLATPQGQNLAVESKKKPDRKTIGLIVAAILLVGVIIWGIRWWTYGRFIESTDDAYLQADSMTIAPKVSGYVAEVLVGDNEAVKAGQPLVKLDNRQYQAILEQANATISARKADIERGAADLLQEKADITGAQAKLEGSKATQAYAESQVKRYEPLVSTGAESGEKLEELRNALRQANASVGADSAALDASQRKPASTQAQVDQAKAQLEAAQASARQSQLDLGDTTITSPLSGRVGDRAVRVGQFAQPGTRLMTIVPVQDIYLTANFKETQIGLMRPGQPATIKVDALRGADLHGTVVSFSPGTGSEFALLPAQNATGNFTKIVQRVPVRIRIDATQATRQVLVPGLSVTVKVDTRSAEPRG